MYIRRGRLPGCMSDHHERSKMITKEILIIARVEARAETVSTNNSCTDEKRWVGVDPVEVVHELDPVAGQELVGFAARRHREWREAHVVESMIVEGWVMW